MTILFAAFCMSCWLHLRSDARQVCTSLVNSATVSFVESECDVLSVYVREVVVDLPEQQEECQLSVSDLPSQ